MNTTFRLLNSFVLGILLVLGLSACDKINQYLPKSAASSPDVVTTKSPEQALEAVQKAFADGQFQQALTEAQAFVDKNTPLQAQFAFEAAKSSAKLGNAQEALRYLEQTIKPMGLETTQLMFEPAFESLQSNPAFLTLITQQGAQSNEQSNSSSGSNAGAGSQNQTTVTTTTTTVTTTQSSNKAVASQPAAQQKKPKKPDVFISKDGSEVKAGDVHIKLP